MKSLDSPVVALAAIVGAVLWSAAALADVTTLAVGTCEVSMCWVSETVGYGAHLVAFLLLLPATLALRARYAGFLGRIGRAAAAVLPVSLALMSAAFLAWFAVAETALVGFLAGTGFAGMFIGALALGVALWRRTDASRLAAFLLIAPLPVVMPLMLLGDALGLAPGHPATMEVAVLLGIATFAYGWLVRPGETETEPALRPAVG